MRLGTSASPRNFGRPGALDAGGHHSRLGPASLALDGFRATFLLGRHHPRRCPACQCPVPAVGGFPAKPALRLRAGPVRRFRIRLCLVVVFLPYGGGYGERLRICGGRTKWAKPFKGSPPPPASSNALTSPRAGRRHRRPRSAAGWRASSAPEDLPSAGFESSR